MQKGVETAVLGDLESESMSHWTRNTSVQTLQAQSDCTQYTGMARDVLCAA